MDDKKVLFVQIPDDIPNDVRERIARYLESSASEYKFVLLSPRMSLLSPEAVGYSLTETIGDYSYTLTAKSPSELFEMRNKLTHKNSPSVPEEPPKRGREFI